MDVLFGSIDVRELLSTQDFEESSPLSAPDLRLLIDKLQIRSLHIKEKVRNYVLSHHNDFSDIISRSSLSLSKTLDISNDVSNVLNLISDNPIDVDIRDTVAKMGETRRELREKREVLDVVKVIVNLSGRLKSVRESLRVGRLVDAAETIRGLKKALLIEDDDEGVVEEVREGEPMVFGLLRKEWMSCFDEVQGVLVRLIENAVVFEPGKHRLRVKFRLKGVCEIEEVELRTVLTAMEIAGFLDYGLVKVADLVVKHVVIPTVRNASCFDFVEEITKDSEEVAEASLIYNPSSNSEVAGENIYPSLIQVVKFIYEYPCFQNARWMQCFGRLSWPRISELVISNFLSKTVPNDASKLAEFQKTIKHTTEFETALKELMFISRTDSKDERLSYFTQNVEVHFASRKKREILSKARNLLLQCDFIVPPECTGKAHGVADYPEQAVYLLFSPHRCVVSRAGSELMEIVHQTLQDVCMSSSRVAMELYHAARDVLLLYEAIVPIKILDYYVLEKQLNSINQVAVVVHNDCIFLSHEILGLAFEYRSEFPSCLKEHAVFVDIAPRFRQMAEEILQKQIQLVSYNLKEAIDGADGFQNTHQMQQYESAKFSIDQVVFILEKVHIIWEPLLLPSTYKRTMCAVLDSVFSLIAKDILLLDDMAADETLQLQRLIHMTLDSLSSLFESLIAIDKKEKLREDVTCIELDELVPSLPKLRRLAGNFSLNCLNLS
ncbi:hypothetical protein GIB67_032796 [Kingdonia uniflora]|uniref:Centromere/kinetochore protein zw10-like protein n=1 Tax=Kingdonia uniflora TaxID=39325 RepID=A0A7J7MW68_9MAGN|nr:hypothetical protein GIB67_032796 [Kingdonia uniflora]